MSPNSRSLKHLPPFFRKLENVLQPNEGVNQKIERKKDSRNRIFSRGEKLRKIRRLTYALALENNFSRLEQVWGGLEVRFPRK